MISSPVNGTLFNGENGVVNIQGITDENTKITVKNLTTDETYIRDEYVVTDSEGRFEKQVTVNTALAVQSLEITVRDRTGNEYKKTVSLTNDALGSISELQMYSGTMEITNRRLSSGSKYPLTLKAKLDNGNVIEINDNKLVEWKQITAQGNAEITEENGISYLDVSEDTQGMVTGRYLISDLGSISVSASFGNGAGTIVDLDNINTICNIKNTYYYTGKAITPDFDLYYNGNKLIKDTDYTVVWSNNIEAGGESSPASLTVTGQGNYKGSKTFNFNIEMMDASGAYEIMGINGLNGWYTGDVVIKPLDGYQISETSQSEGFLTEDITVSAEGENQREFYIRRMSDNAVSAKITEKVKIDKTVPTAEIKVARKKWNVFPSEELYTKYKIPSMLVEVDAQDGISGMESIDYTIVKDRIYETVDELKQAGLTWVSYNKDNPPLLTEGEKQVVYVRLTDKAGNSCYIGTEGILPDNTAPEISNAAIKEDESLGATYADITISINESGSYYYALLPDGVQQPTEEQLKAQNIGGEGVVVGTGTISEDNAGNVITNTVSNLLPNTMYKLYVTATDTAVDLETGEIAGNTSAVVSSGAVKTRMVDLNSDNTTCDIKNTYYYTGNEITPDFNLYYNGNKLIKDTDYTVIWSNNIEAGSESSPASLTVNGQGNYKGSKTFSFNIEVMDDSGTYEIMGINGLNDWYTGDVVIKPLDGYQISETSQSEGFLTEGITVSTEGENEPEFYIRRISDNAVSAKITEKVKIDKTVPMAEIKVAQRKWNVFPSEVLFTKYKMPSMFAEVDAQDGVSGMESIDYTIVKDRIYKTADELKQTGLIWVSYNKDNPPLLTEGEKQVVYVRLSDKAGNSCYIGTEGILPDNTAPEISNAVIKEDESLGATQADIMISINESGSYYYALLPDGVQQPTEEQLKAQNISGEGVVVGTGIVSEENAGKVITSTVSNLLSDTMYRLYVVAVDAAVDFETGLIAGNTSVVVPSEAVRTKAFEEPVTPQPESTEETTENTEETTKPVEETTEPVEETTNITGTTQESEKTMSTTDVAKDDKQMENASTKTGDDSLVVLYVCMCIIVAIAGISVYYCKKKDVRNSDE